MVSPISLAMPETHRQTECGQVQGLWSILRTAAQRLGQLWIGQPELAWSRPPSATALGQPESSSCTLLPRCFILLKHSNPSPNFKDRKAEQVLKLVWKGLSKLEETESRGKKMSQEGK